MARDSSSVLADLWNRISGFALTVGGLALVLALGYVVYGLFGAADTLFGALQPGGAGRAAHQQVMRNMQLVGMVLTYGSIALALGVIARYWMFPEAGVGLVTAGLAFFFGLPFLVHSAAGAYPDTSRAPVENLLVGQFTLMGALFLGVGGLQLVVHTAQILLSRGGKRPGLSTDVSQGAFTEKKVEKRDQFLGPCWTLPFCRDSNKRVCPVLNRKKPCWVDGRGCYCDQNIVLMLSGDRGTRAPGRSVSGFVPAQALAGTQRQKSRAEKRTQCLGCPIYLHRQSQKYRLFAPSAIAAVLALILLNKQWVDEIWPETILAVGRAARSFALSSGTETGAVPGWALELSTNSGLEWMVLLIAGFMLVGYLLHGVEWALYKLGV